MPPRWCASSVSRDTAGRKSAGNFWKANSVDKLFPFVRWRASQQSMPFHFPIRHPINRLMSFAPTNQDWSFSLALTGEMPWLAVKYNNIKQRANRPRTLSRVSLLLRFQQFLPKWGLHERNLWNYGEEEMLGFICVVVGCVSRQDYCQLDVSFAFLVHFPFIKIKNRSFSNLMDKYLSGGGRADVFSFLLLFSRWMGISALGTRSDGNLTTCYGVPGLSSQQMSVCQSKPDLIPTLRRGANLGITECQKQFEKERWNCSTTNSSSVFGEIIDIGEFKLNLVEFFPVETRWFCNMLPTFPWQEVPRLPSFTR